MLRCPELQAAPFASPAQVQPLVAKCATEIGSSRAFYSTQDLPYEQQLEALGGHLSLNALLDDAAEGVAAFLTKRSPEWKGR